MSSSPIPYKLVRSKRRSVALVISRDATLTVRAPLRTPIGFIEAFLREKAVWVEQAVERMRGRQANAERRYREGEQFWYVGKEYPLRISETAKQSLVFSGESFVLSQRFHSRAKERFLSFYRREAKKILSDRVRCMAREKGFDVSSIKVNAARTRWGSCSGKGNLNFSFRLVMAPLSVIDYVIAHELAHIKHRNHSRAFWQTVGELFPGYEREHRWLKKNGHLLECSR